MPPNESKLFEWQSHRFGPPWSYFMTLLYTVLNRFSDANIHCNACYTLFFASLAHTQSILSHHQVSPHSHTPQMCWIMSMCHPIWPYTMVGLLSHQKPSTPTQHQQVLLCHPRYHHLHWHLDMLALHYQLQWRLLCLNTMSVWSWTIDLDCSSVHHREEPVLLD